MYADLIAVGRTSMKFKVEAWRRSRDGDEQTKVTEAVFTFVAIDSGSRPGPFRRLEGDQEGPSRGAASCESGSLLKRRTTAIPFPSVPGSEVRPREP